MREGYTHHLEGLNSCRWRSGEFSLGETVAVSCGLLPWRWIQAGCRCRGGTAKRVTHGGGAGEGVGRSGAQRQKGRFYGEDLRGKERGSPEPCRVWETPGQEKLDATIRRSWASCHVIRGGDWLGWTVAGGRSHVIS